MNSAEQDQNLSELVGAIVSSIAHARGVADAEALRLAHIYRRNELLKGLPVPRLRLRNINISLPLLISGMSPSEAGTLNTSANIASACFHALQRGLGLLLARLKQKADMESLPEEERNEACLYSILINGLFEESEKDTRTLKKERFEGYKHIFTSRIGAVIDEALERNGNDVATSSEQSSIETYVADSVAEATRRLLQELFFTRLREFAIGRQKDLPEAERKPFDPARARLRTEAFLHGEDGGILVEDARRAAAQSCYRQQAKPAEIRVIAGTDNVKNCGAGPEMITRINMTIHEEGLEWTSQPDGGADRLCPE
ncbi:MAG: hypothetical protein JW942_07985 [Opitutales bacterium]|nr:hypothetical protein [Opitutales bacterium]